MFPSTLSSIYQNPYWVIDRTHINGNRDRVIGFLSAKFNLTSWLSIQGSANLDKTLDNDENQVSQGTVLWAKSGGDYQKQNIIITDQWLDARLEGVNNITPDLENKLPCGCYFPG
jgi:hypothetical protein